MCDVLGQRLRTCWKRAWPACLCVGAFLLIWIASVLGSLFSPGTRLGNSIWVGGLLFLLAFGLPLLVAWGVWSGLRLRHWAARSVLYGVLALGVIGLCLWFVVSNPPQM